MLQTRVMPCLLLRDGALVKTVRFRDPSYVGDPVNAIRIYNEKEVDELIFLDIAATKQGRRPPIEVLKRIAGESFMPAAYGGGLQGLEDIGAVLKLGFEKVSVNTYAAQNPSFISEASREFGSQSIIVSIDARRTSSGRYEVWTHGGTKKTSLDPAAFAAQMQAAGAGEILLTSIDRDGTQQGYDVDLIRQVVAGTSVPVIACGGAGKIEDFRAAVKEGGAAACAIGSMAVYYGRNRAVLISFPRRAEIEQALGEGGY